ncbi:hypothetical protein AVEN_122925-1 [Araneus ventricosus]|uniref:F-box domain-containing protein n=1 Tax=Araneus ventricosus TaxID=182803 RepID=A0A4Y2WKL6_ARAVE|nr:hypothetical protein AVEN_122925-1 [Araneus ventricosus]
MGAVFWSEIVSDGNAIDPIGVQYTEEKRDSETVQSITSNETEKCEKQGKWSELPSLPLEKIYSFLRREDQVNMSLVCRSWSEGYSSPSVWKTFRFALSEPQLSMDTCPVMKFVQKYSNMFRHVEIKRCHTQNNGLMKIFCGHVTEFLQILMSNTQLISVKFLYFGKYLWRIDNLTYNDICREIAEFLASQRDLKRVEFDQCSFSYKESVELLRNLNENSRESLTHLKLQNFLSDENTDIEQDSNAAQKLPMLADLYNLKTLDTDYSFIFENMVARQSSAIQTGKNCKTLVLSKLILYYCSEYTDIADLRGLTSTNWWLMKRLYPDLQVEFLLITDSLARRVFQFLILPNMPISRLECLSNDFNQGTEIAVLFDHLLACKTNEHLVSLKIDWDEPTQHLSSYFIPFLQTCKKLKCLDICVFSPITGMDVLLQSWLENRPESLENVIIDIVYLHNENDFPGWISVNEYVSLLKLAGLNISVNFNI